MRKLRFTNSQPKFSSVQSLSHVRLFATPWPQHTRPPCPSPSPGVYPNLRPLDCKKIQPVHPKGDQSWVFTGRTNAKAETPILWPPDAKSWLIGKDTDAQKDWGQEEKGTTEDETAGWHHWLDGRESEWTPGVGDGQGGLACCDSWGRKESDTAERLNWTELNWKEHFMKRWAQ